MDKLKELLGLAADASDEDVVAAVTALQEQVAQANKEKEDAEAESFAEEHKAVCNKDALKKAYLLNKEAARGLVAGLVPAVPAPAKKEEPPQTILNKETSATPALKNKAREGLAACKSAAERVDYVQKHAAELAAN